jgi:hypothetical protein
MARIAHALGRVARDPLADLPPELPVDQLLADRRVTWRDRLLPPLTTLRLLLVQIAHGNCAIAALRHLSGLAFAPSSYCEARGRLPVELIYALLGWVRDAAAAHVAAATARVARRVFVVDGSTFSVPDAPGLAAHFDRPHGTRPGVGYPAGRLIGLLDAATGMFESLLALPVFGHDVRGAADVHPMLRAGDILLGDRAFCSFAHLALLRARGVFACVRLHQARKVQGAGAQRWPKPKARPVWLDAAQYAPLPASLDVRVVRYAVAHAGFRTRHVLVATTLPADAAWTDARVAELYGHRWQVETCFAHLKTTMGMDALRCKTVDGVTKELAAYLAVYNLVRLAMLRAAAAQGVADPARVSFVDALRRLAARLVGLGGVERLIVNPARPGRAQLRVIRRRGKEYDWLIRPRRQQEAQVRHRQADIN